MRASLDGHDLGALTDTEAHCIAAGLIARRCSTTESALASLGKEIADVFGRGDAEMSDLSADREGVRCAGLTSSEAEMLRCCRQYATGLQHPLGGEP